MMQLDVLAFGPHPDDLEIGIGGVLIKQAKLGYKVGMVDLTAGETGSNGTPELRRQEALRAAEIMGVVVRECLHLPDAKLAVTHEMLVPIIEIIRKYKPRVVLGPNSVDGHPDHIAAHKLIKDGAHLAGLRKYPDAGGKMHRPPVILQYSLSLGSFSEPKAVVDISAYHETKMEAICAHASQFGLMGVEDVATYVNDPAFLRSIRARDAFYGSMIQVPYAEAIYMDETMVVDDVMNLRGRIRMSQTRPRS